MPFRVEEHYAGRQLQGLRENQEDFYVFSDAAYDVHGHLSALLLILADGMGGHAAGERASYATVNGFLQGYHDNPGPVRQRLENGLNRANQAVGDEAARDPKRLSGMGSTLVAAVIDQQSIHWVSVGDSLLLLFRDGRMRRLNADHSFAPLVEAQLANGEIIAGDNDAMALSNSLQSAIMGDSLELFDLPDTPTPLLPGDIIIAATDGMLTLTDSRTQSLLRLLTYRPASEIAKVLLASVEAEHDNLQDNTTVAVVKIPAGSEQPQSARAGPTRRKSTPTA